MNTKKRKKLWATGIIILLGIFVCSLVNCKSPESPEEIIASIVVSNECGLEIDVYMDGIFQFSVEFLFYEVIEDVSTGTYKIIAQRKDTGEEIANITVTVNATAEYWISIVGKASLNIINEYGETLNIYTNGSLQGELEDQENQVFDNVPYGEHILEAAKASDNSFVATTIIDVTEEKEYTWTIK